MNWIKLITSNKTNLMRYLKEDKNLANQLKSSINKNK